MKMTSGCFMCAKFAKTLHQPRFIGSENEQWVDSGRFGTGAGSRLDLGTLDSILDFSTILPISLSQT